MAADEFDTPAGRLIERDRWGRPLIVPPDGGKPRAYTRCTTFVDALDDKYNLSRWQQRMVVLGLADRPDLVLSASAVDTDDKAALNSIADQAMDAAKARAAANTGTALHSLTERVDRGQPLGTIPDAYRADVDAYRAATAEFHPLCIETFTVLDDLRIGGTPDRVVRYGDRAYIADVKTGSVEYAAGKISMQLAVYSRALRYNPDGGQRSDYPEPVDRERGIVIHLPAGTGECHLYWVDIAAGWDAVQLAGNVRTWRARRGLLDAWPDTPAPADTGASGDLSVQLATIANAADVAELRRLYVAYVDAGADADRVNAACRERIAELEQAA